VYFFGWCFATEDYFERWSVLVSSLVWQKGIFCFVFVLFLFCFCFVFVLFLFCFCFVFVLSLLNHVRPG